MGNPSSHRPFADRLLEQETRISEAQMDEYRRNLQRKLARTAARERRMRAIILVLVAVVVMGLLSSYVVGSISPELFPSESIERAPAVVLALGFALVFACPICLVVFLLLYLLHYRPKLQQTRQEQILTLLHDLQRQIAELRRRNEPEEK